MMGSDIPPTPTQIHLLGTSEGAFQRLGVSAVHTPIG